MSDDPRTDAGDDSESAAEPALDDEPSERASSTGTDDPNGEPPESDRSTRDGAGLSGRLGVAVSAIVGVLVTVISYWAVQGAGPFFEEMPRVQPTVEDRGVGSDWVVGNTDPALDAMIALVHAADVILGVFILVMVFIHWAAFRRLADRMQQPGEATTTDAVAADGGERADADSRRGGEPE